MPLSAFATHVSPRYAAKLLQHYGAIALFTEWEDTACEIRGATRRMSIPAAGSTGAASTDRFIDITLQESRDYPAGKVRLRGSRASGGRQGGVPSTSSFNCRATTRNPHRRMYVSKHQYEHVTDAGKGKAG